MSNGGCSTCTKLVPPCYLDIRGGYLLEIRSYDQNKSCKYNNLTLEEIIKADLRDCELFIKILRTPITLSARLLREEEI